MTPPKKELDAQTLETLIQAEDISTLSFSDLSQLFREEPSMHNYLPDGIYQVDPRNNDRVVFNRARARRPHDNRTPQETGTTSAQRPCVVCQGHTTGIVDRATLSNGHTFINKNLYPILCLENAQSAMKKRGDTSALPAQGLHFLQWTSSKHDKDWHNLPLSDCRIVFNRLAALEKTLLDNAANIPRAPSNPTAERAFVSIIKNCGRLVGGSLSHGHQQILFSNLIPRRILDNWEFERRHQECFSAYMLRENPRDLYVRDYGAAVLLVPYFMRRPYDMLLILKDTTKRYLHELTTAEQIALANGWQNATRLLINIMPRLGRELAYNIVTHNGPGAGLYFEFLPYTQEMGGYEHLGLFLCQGDPQTAAANLREYLSQNLKEG